MLNYKFIKKEENTEKLNQELKEENEYYLKEKIDIENLNKDLKKKLQEKQVIIKQLNESYEKILLNDNKIYIEDKKELYEDLKNQYDEVSNNLKQKNNDEKTIFEFLKKELKGVKDENENLKKN